MRTGPLAARGAILGLLSPAFLGCSEPSTDQAVGAQPIVAEAPATILLSALSTQSVPHDTDDPAIWINPADASRSLILGTDKVEKDGGIYVFDLDGKIVASVTLVNYPNNVDVAGPFKLDGTQVDVAVASERESNRLRIVAIDRVTGAIEDVSGKTDVFSGALELDMARPMGVALERSPEGDLYVWLSRKVSPVAGPLGRHRLVVRNGKIDVGPIELFGEFSGEGEIEALCRIPDGRLFYCDENDSVKQLDPKTNKTTRFGLDVFTGDREGIAYLELQGKTLLIVSDQIEGGSELEVFDVTGPEPSHVKTIKTMADDTDGIEITQRSLGEKFPSGVLVMMNSKDHNFLVFDLRDVIKMIER